MDLQDEFVLSRFAVFNRRERAERLCYFSVLTSLDGQSWKVIYKKDDGVVFGRDDDLPYVGQFDKHRLARFVRIRLDGLSCLHFRECQVFGDRPDARSRECILHEEASADAARNVLPEGRQGHIAHVGGFAVFVDAQRYAGPIADALNAGWYEGRERQLIRKLLTRGDRVIEVGTAVGVVSMTAAAIVGASEVLTFDANPDIVMDARANFLRNGLGGIKSRLGVLRCREHVGGDEQFVDFHVMSEFWASRIARPDDRAGILKTVKTPVFCLEDQIEAHQANVLICDIEGGETDLLLRADLTGINTIFMETHYAFVGEPATDAMIRNLIIDGFALHLGHSGQELVVLRR